MFNKVLEISQRANRAGRVPIKVALLKIHSDITETNKNGLHWDEEYVKQAIDSVKIMPICAAFSDEKKEIPLDHGFTGTEINDDGISEPIFQNSETVGCYEKAYIETINIDGTEIKALVGEGYLFNQRYPNFVKWVRKNYALGKVDTSIEIMGTAENGNRIQYKEDTPTAAYRTPCDFAFSGSAILSVSPADENAIVLEVAQQKKDEEDAKMEFTLEDIKGVVQSVVTETNTSNEAYEKQISELNDTVAEKDGLISEKDKEISELNEKLNELSEKVNSFADTENELNELKKEKRVSELEKVLSEYSEDEQKYAETEINSFKEDPLNGDIEQIKSKICVAIVEAKKAKDVSERNSKANEVPDIFSEVTSGNDEKADDINIF